MSVVNFQGKGIESSAKFGNYRGAETPATFSNTAAEFRALLDGAAIFDMQWQAKLRIGGKDRTRWANGMVTNNIRDLQPGRGVYCFLLTPQGRIQGDLVVYNRGEDLLATTDQSQLEAITTLLRRYIIMDKVELEDISDQQSTIGLAGPRAPEVLATIGVAASALEPGQLREASWHSLNISVTRSTHPQWDGYEIWVSPEHAGEIWKGLTAAGATPVGSEALEMYRIVRGVPHYGVDVRERDLPQETGQEHALNFSKGCYIGQEIVERIRSRGSVHRTLTGFEVEGEAPQQGTKVLADGKEMGEITSAALLRFPEGDRTLALGYLRREIATPGTSVQVGEQTATVCSLPF